MFRPLTPHTARRPRRGAIIVVVLALLALFAVIAISFVYYSDNEATISKFHKDAENVNGNGNAALPVAEYDKVMNDLLTALLVGVDDAQPASLLNALRGRSFLDTYVGGIPATWTGVTPYQNNPAERDNVTPSVVFNGVGSLQENTALGRRAQVINHTAFRVGPNTFLIDPHWTGQRAVTAGTQLGQAPTLSTAAVLGRFYAPMNAGYTYPDLNNLVLASISPVTGRIQVQSLHRNWLFNAANTVNPSYRLAPWNPLDTANGTDQNTDWISPEGRAKVLRPRPVDQLTDSDFLDPAFAPLAGRPLPGLANYATPALRLNLYRLITDRIATGKIIGYPPPNAVDPATGRQTFTGDVQNLTGGVGVQENDSILVDLGLPAQKYNNRLIKPLVSILVVDQDGLIDLNAHGNAANTGAHGSVQGFGPWEVNPLRLYDNETVPATKTALLTEMSTLVRSRYGSTGNPTARNGRFSLPFSPAASRLSQASLVNWNAAGASAVGPTPAFQLPTFTPVAGYPANPFATNPLYGGPGFFDDDVFDAGEPADKARNHPGLYRPSDWPTLAAGMSLANPFAFPVGDLRRFRHRYAAPLDEYRQTSVHTPGMFVRDGVIGTYPSATAAEQASYRLDPAHARRLLLTLRGGTPDLPGLAPAYDRVDSTQTLQLPAGSVHAFHAAAAFPQAYPAAPQPTGGAPFPSDFAPPATGNTKVDGRNVRAALGPVDLNRPLADFRNDPTQPLSPANVGNQLQARVDRQNLARDIYARLVVATGANALVDPVTGNVQANAPPAGDDFRALRYLAQLAVNIVDAVDNDDANTLFVWNPPAGGPGSSGPLAPVDASATPTGVDALTAAGLAEVQDRVVFGVEKPRLVINEAYAEVANDPTDTFPAPMMVPTKDARVRVWVELLNPTATPSPTGLNPAGPQGAGDAVLHYPVGPGVPVAFSPYQLVVTRADNSGQNVPNNLADPANVTGDVTVPGGAAVTPDILLTFDNTGGTTVVPPNNGNYAPVAGRVPGVLVVGPTVTGGRPTEYAPTGFPTALTYVTSDTPGPGVSTVMAYTLNSGTPNKPPSATNLEVGTSAAGRNGDLRRHVVLLRRLANPYLPPSAANPYLSADTMDHVPAHDAVIRGETDMMDRMPRSARPGAGYDDFAIRFAAGKIEPYAGFAQRDATTGFVPAAAQIGTTFSAVVQQAPNPVLATEPQHTLGRHNGRTPTAPAGPTFTANPPALLGGETLAAPFDWLVHPDRPMVNALELLHVQAVKPHLVTQYTLQPPAGGPVRRGAGEAPWLGVQGVGDPQPGLPAFDDAPATGTGRPRANVTAANPRSKNGLFRALDLIRAKPWGAGGGVGGRVQGRVNLNTIQDVRVLMALLDPPDTAGTNGNAFDTAAVQLLWEALINPATPTAGVPYRTVARATADEAGFDPNPANTTPANLAKRHYVPTPGPTVDDDPTNPNADRPFRLFGAADLPQGGVVGAAPGGVGLQDTLLRTDPATGRPIIDNPSQAHPYLRAEMARKLLNNATAVSNVFAVHVTVVWHEVRQEGGAAAFFDEGTLGGQPVRRQLLGKEVFRETPGDMRQQYFAIVDRSNLLLQADPAQPTKFASPPVVVEKPVFTALEVQADAGATTITVPAVADPNSGAASAPSDGVLVPLAGSTLVIGTGANAEVRQVAMAANPVPGPGGGSVSVLTLSAALALPHAAGEQVSNGLAGHPGYQKVSVVGTGTSPFRGVVPYVQRVSR